MKKLKLAKDFIFEVGGRKFGLNQFLSKINVSEYIVIPRNLKINDTINLPEKFWEDVLKKVKDETGESFIKSVFKENIQDAYAVEYLNPVVLYKGCIANEIYLCRIVMK